MRHLFILSLIVLLKSCEQSLHYELSDCPISEHPSLQYKAGKTIYLDSIKSFKGQCSVKYTDRQIQFISEQERSIKSYDLNNHITVEKISYANIDGEVYDFWCDDEEEKVYLLYRNPNQFISIDHNKEVEYIFSEKNKTYIHSYPFLNDKLRIHSDGHFIASSFSELEPEKNAYLFKENFVGGSRTYAFEKIPEIFSYYQFPLMSFPSKIEVDSKILISYGFSSSIKEYQDSILINEHCAQSKFIPNHIEGIDLETSFQESSNYIIEKGFYLGLFYNAFEQRYYRIVKHKQALKNDQNQLNNRYDGTWSIIVLDRDFQILGEVEMPSNTYDYYAALCIDAPGIWIAKKSNSLEFEQIIIE